LRGSPLRRASIRRVVEFDGEPVAAGQTVVEGEVAGLYDIVTASAWRGRGIGRALSALLLSDARACGASTAYLQVDAGNVPARSVYARLGFVDRYAYWYRQPAHLDAELLH
jgi:ribosomal protein S18 acetylase RimI-like enzyme